jgi:hypothetical protein
MPLSKRLYSHKKDCENGCSQRQFTASVKRWTLK